MENYKKFVDKLCSLNNVPLQKTKDVIDKRRAIENQIEVLSMKLKQGTYLFESFRNISKQLERQKIAITKGINFEIEQDTLEPVKNHLKKGTFTTRCYKYNFTCHEICRIKPNDSPENKRHCAAMNNDYCKHCPKKCHYSFHHNDEHIVDWKLVKKKSILINLKRNITSIIIQKILMKRFKLQLHKILILLLIVFKWLKKYKHY